MDYKKAWEKLNIKLTNADNYYHKQMDETTNDKERLRYEQKLAGIELVKQFMFDIEIELE